MRKRETSNGVKYENHIHPVHPLKTGAERFVALTRWCHTWILSLCRMGSTSYHIIKNVISSKFLFEMSRCHEPLIYEGKRLGLAFIFGASVGWGWTMRGVSRGAKGICEQGCRNIFGTSLVWSFPLVHLWIFRSKNCSGGMMCVCGGGGVPWTWQKHKPRTDALSVCIGICKRTVTCSKVA